MSGGPRNLIDVLRLSDQEVFYASTLAWLLDPRESHGLGRGLLEQLAKFVSVHHPQLGPELLTNAVTCNVARPARPQVQISAGNAHIALVITTHDPPTPHDRPAPPFVPLAAGFDASLSKSLPTWDLGQAFLFLQAMGDQSTPRWRHYLSLLTQHLGGQLAERGISPELFGAQPEAPPPTPAPTPAPAPAPAPGPAWSGGLGGGLSDGGGGWVGGGWGAEDAAAPAAADSGGGWGGGLSSGGSLADAWDAQDTEEALPPDPTPAPAPAPEPVQPSATIIDRSTLVAQHDVGFAGAGTLLDIGEDDMNKPASASGSRMDIETEAGKGKRSSPRAMSLVRSLGEVQKAMGYFRLYPREHPFCAQAIESSFKFLKDHLDQFGPLAVRIQREGVFLESTLVIADSGDLTSLSYLLYPEGIRSLTFDTGLTPREVYEFVEALSGQEETEISLDQDLLSSLWRRDFNHVHYLTYDQLSPAGLRNVHDPTLALVADSIREVVALIGSDGVDDDQYTSLLRTLPAIDQNSPATWATLPQKVMEYCNSPQGVERQALRASLLDKFLGDSLGRAADLVAWANTHEGYEPHAGDEANFLTGMVLNALWKGNLDGALDLVARAAGGDKLASPELLQKLGSEQCLVLLARCLQAQKETISAGELNMKGSRYLSRLGPETIPNVMRTLSLQVDPDVRRVFWRYLKTRAETDAEAISKLSTHANETLVKETIDLLAGSKAGRALLAEFAKDRREPVRAKLASNTVGRVTGTFSRDKDLRIVESYPIKKDRVEALKRLGKDKNPQAFARICKAALGKEFAKRDPDEIELTFRTLTAMGGPRCIRLFNDLANRKAGMFGGKDIKKVAEVAKKHLLQMKKQGK